LVSLPATKVSRQVFKDEIARVEKSLKFVFLCKKSIKTIVIIVLIIVITKKEKMKIKSCLSCM